MYSNRHTDWKTKRKAEMHLSSASIGQNPLPALLEIIEPFIATQPINKPLLLSAISGDVNASLCLFRAWLDIKLRKVY